MKQTILIFAAICLLQTTGLCQQDDKIIVFGSTAYQLTDSGVVEADYKRSGCKNYIFSPKEAEVVPCTDCGKQQNGSRGKTPRLLTIHGNIAYDYFSRSGIDSPFKQQPLEQHTERVWLDMTYKERYPVRVGFTARQGNNSFLRDFTSMNLNFDKSRFVKLKRDKLYAAIDSMKTHTDILEKYDTAIALERMKIHHLDTELQNPFLLQKIIEERERQSMRQLNRHNASSQADSAINDAKDTWKFPGNVKTGIRKRLGDEFETDSLKSRKISVDVNAVDSVGSRVESGDSTYKSYLDEKGRQLTKSRARLDKLVKMADSIKGVVRLNKTRLRNELGKAKTAGELNEFSREHKLDIAERNEMDKFLSNIKSVGLGRNLADYTELTAKDIMLTGVNVEYQDRLYAVFTAGKIDYGFRDFFGREYFNKNQYLVMGRLGRLNRRGEGVILSLFKGRKNSYPDVKLPDTVRNYSDILGYSVEMIFRNTKNIFLSAEIAKSTKYFAAADSLSDKTNNLFKIDDATNLGLNVKGHYILKNGRTVLSGFFRKTGERFQSFSLFTFNTQQQAWQMKVDHSMLEGRLSLTGMVRQNDYTNLLTDRTFKTSTIFKSAVATLRIPKYPVLSVGYYPGQQFFVVDRNTVTENAYYILNASGFYSYTAGEVQFNSSVLYNRFFNKATDSGFVSYKGINLLFNQAMIYKRLQLSGGVSLNNQPEIHYSTAEAGMDYELLKFLRVGGSMKYNKVKNGEEYLGHMLRLSASIRNKAGVQVSYEKSYIPTVSETLFPIQTGRVSLFKTF